MSVSSQTTDLAAEKKLPTQQEILAATTILSPYDSTSTIVKLDDEFLVKYGKQVTEAEAEAMRYVANNSDVPIPKVHAFWTDHESGNSFIVMDYIPGQTLESMLPSLSDRDKEDVRELIRDALTKLRAMPEQGYLGAVNRGACTHDMFWALEPPASGPFSKEAEFNEGLLTKLSTIPHMDPPVMHLYRTLFRQACVSHRTVFTHGDLQPKNIMVNRKATKEDGSGEFEIFIVDWETAGWYPEYWEFCHAIMIARHLPEWTGMINEVMQIYGYEYALMQMVFHVLYY